MVLHQILKSYVSHFKADHQFTQGREKGKTMVTISPILKTNSNRSWVIFPFPLKTDPNLTR